MAAVDFTQLRALEADVEVKDQAVSDAGDAAAAADATLAIAQQASTAAHSALDAAHAAFAASAKALTDYVNTLVSQ